MRNIAQQLRLISRWCLIQTLNFRKKHERLTEQFVYSNRISGPCCWGQNDGAWFTSRWWRLTLNYELTPVHFFTSSVLLFGSMSFTFSKFSCLDVSICSEKSFLSFTTFVSPLFILKIRSIIPSIKVINRVNPNSLNAAFGKVNLLKSWGNIDWL